MSISLTRILQQITGLNTFFAGPSASRDNGVVLLDSATVSWTTDGQGNVIATAAGATLPTATGAGQVLTATGPGTTYTAQALPVGSATQGGIVEVDGTTITAVAGVISSTPAAMVLIQEQTISTDTAAVTFSSIPQTYKHLKLIWAGGTVGNAGETVATWNGNTTNYNISGFALPVGGGSAVQPGFGQPGVVVGGTMGEATFPNYAASGGSVLGSGTTNGGTFYIGAGYDGAGTGAVTSITLTAGGHWTAGTFSLYGIK